MVSLFLTLIQTLIAMMDCEGGNFMTNRLLVECGTHGVVQFLGEYRCCYKCRVGSNPARSARISEHYRCRRLNAYGINRFRVFYALKFEV